MHAGVERARAQQRVGRDEVVEAVAAHARSTSVASGDSNWNTPAVRPARSMRYGRLVVERQRRRASICDARALDDRSSRASRDDGERREAEEVHLEHASLLEAFMSYCVTIDRSSSPAPAPLDACVQIGT